MMRKIQQQSLAIGCWLLLVISGSCGAAAPLDEALSPLLKAHRGQVGVMVKHLPTGETFQHRAAEVMPTASLIKLPVMIEAYRQAAAGQLDLNASVTLREADKVQGSGILTLHFSAGARISLRDAIRLMIAYSDNTATNLVLDQIGLKATADAMQELGFPNTKIHAKVFRGETSVFPDRSKKFGLGSTTAAEMVTLLERLHDGKLADEKTSKEMIEHLLNCQDDARFSRLLPAGTKVAHKTGSVSRVRTDAGLIYSPSGPIALCVLSAENEDQRWIDDNAANLLCAKVAKIAFDHFNPDKRIATKPGLLELGTNGVLVEDLQRTLNVRLKRSPAITVDGEFGNETKEAVLDFQQQNDLEATGLVAAETWKALGTLVTSDPPVPEPEVINGEPLERAEPDVLTGPPHVTCKAWAIADGKTGALLTGHHEEQSLDMASTTKIMTAYLVLKLAKEEPAVLDEIVTFSERADNTGGSSARIRAGERLSVRELLYGLMLPSGNDASVALAERFGERFAIPPQSASEPTDALDLFVAEMNRAAQSLGMTRTTYKNPHGLTDKGHKSTAKDLGTLAFAALQLPEFREYVNTRRHGCTLIGPGGYRRNVLWENTNHLLPIQGYDGVKTGTTSAAGACLVSSGKRGDNHLLVVVLGATSGDARYVDARNLFRWWWLEGSRVKGQ